MITIPPASSFRIAAPRRMRLEERLANLIRALFAAARARHSALRWTRCRLCQSCEGGPLIVSATLECVSDGQCPHQLREMTWRCPAILQPKAIPFSCIPKAAWHDAAVMQQTSGLNEAERPLATLHGASAYVVSRTQYQAAPLWVVECVGTP